MMLVLAAGCPSVSTFTTAKTVGDGKNEFAFSPTFYGITPTVTGGEDVDMVYGGAIDFMYRRGIGDHFGLGVSLTGLGQLGIDGKINFLDTEHVAMAIDPGVGGVFVGLGEGVGGGYLQVNAPLLIDLAFGDSVRLTLAPKYTGIFAFGVAEGHAAAGSTHFVGGATGLEIKAGRVFRIMPHGGILYWLDQPEGSDVTNVILVSGGVAFKFVF
jgi:hypothetical protein